MLVGIEIGKHMKRFTGSCNGYGLYHDVVVDRALQKTRILRMVEESAIHDMIMIIPCLGFGIDPMTELDILVVAMILNLIRLDALKMN